jgi:5'-methylthioadenosine phosphorylase
MEGAEIGIIGGSGFYEMPGLEDPHYLRLNTPFGPPSEKILLGRIHQRPVAFLSRHGIGHRFSPSEVNYRANLYAMKLLKVERLISVTAVGSLKEELKPTDLVIPDQYVDNTYKREKTYFENGIVAHVSLAQPTCPHLSALAETLSRGMGITVHQGGVYCNMEGPQFSTLGESLTYRQLGYSLIGMTQAVEAKLARELEICFLPLAFVTDYDCWHQEAEPVTVEMVVANLSQNTGKARELIRELVMKIGADARSCDCGQALANAIITSPAMIPDKTFKKMEMIIGKYIKDRI